MARFATKIHAVICLPTDEDGIVMKDFNPLINALVILFFLSKTHKSLVRLDDDIGDYFSNGFDADTFVIFCEDLKFYLTKNLFAPNEECFITVSDYYNWFSNLIFESDCDKIILQKWIDYRLVYLGSSWGLCMEKIIVNIRKRFGDKNGKTRSLQRLVEKKRMIWGMVRKNEIDMS